MNNFNWDGSSSVISRGRASRLPEDLPLGIDSVRYAGWRPSLLTLGTTVTIPINVPDQANFFYYSGHGLHQTGKLLIDDTIKGGQKDAGADDVEWQDGLEVVIIAGCSILDINNYNNNWRIGYTPPAGWKPGDAWSQTGPQVFLGYNWFAPLDLQNGEYAAANIIQSWIQNREGYGDVHSWMQANNNSNGRNASAIDASQGTGNRVYWYWHRISRPFIPDLFDLTSVHEGSW